MVADQGFDGLELVVAQHRVGAGDERKDVLGSLAQVRFDEGVVRCRSWVGSRPRQAVGPDRARPQLERWPAPGEGRHSDL